MKKIMCLILLVSLCCGLLTGCGSGDSMSASALKKLPAMTLEEIASTRLVEQANASGVVGDNSILEYVSDRVVVDATKLMKVKACSRVKTYNIFTTLLPLKRCLCKLQ